MPTSPTDYQFGTNSWFWLSAHFAVTISKNHRMPLILNRTLSQLLCLSCFAVIVLASCMVWDKYKSNRAQRAATRHASGLKTISYKISLSRLILFSLERRPAVCDLISVFNMLDGSSRLLIDILHSLSWDKLKRSFVVILHVSCRDDVASLSFAIQVTNLWHVLPLK